MATLNSAVQSIVDNLHSKMTSNSPLTPEEQTLVAAAIDKLANHASWENALVAVAEQHLNTATNNMSQTLATATSALTSAQSDINTAKDTIQTQNANLAMIPTIQSNMTTALNNFGQSNSAEIKGGLAGLTRPVFGLKHIENSSSESTSIRSSAIFAVYDSDGSTYAARPSHTTHTSSHHYNRLEYLKLLSDGSGVTVMKSHYVHNSNFHQNPTSYIYRFGQSAILPLASKDDSNNIAYEVVYSTSDSASTAAANYAGIFCATSGYTSVTKPRYNINATDQWGVTTVTDHSWNYVGVLYDNNKHCLVIVDSETGNLIEKYRDGNVETSVNVLTNEALQQYVDNGDFTVVRFIAHYMAYPKCNRRYDGTLTNSSISHYSDCYTFYGRLSNETRMGGDSYCAHYRYTAEKRLEPLNLFASSSVSQNRVQAASGGTVNSLGEVDVAISDMQGNTLGLYNFKSKSDYAGNSAGYLISAIMCMNPYSNIGIINEGLGYDGATTKYGVGRTCRAF